GVGNLDIGIRAEANNQGRREKGQREKNAGHLRHLPGQSKNTGANHDAGTQHHRPWQSETTFLVASASIFLPAHSISSYFFMGGILEQQNGSCLAFARTLSSVNRYQASLRRVHHPVFNRPP